MRMLFRVLVLVAVPFGSNATAQLLSQEQHPGLLFNASDIPLLQERIKREPYATWWRTISARVDAAPSVYDNDRAKARQAKSLAFAFAMTGNEDYAAEGVRLLQEIVFPPRGGDMGEPHLEGDVVALYATAYDMLHPFLVRDEQAMTAIRGSLAEEAGRLFKGLKVGVGSLKYRLHATDHLDNWHLRVYGALGLAAWALAEHEGYGGSDPEDWAGRAFDVVTRALDFQIEPEDGSFAEGPFYARYAADLYMPYLLTLKEKTGINLFVDAKLRKMHLWQLNLRLPNGRRPNIEDGHIEDFYGHYLAAVDPIGGVHRWDWENNEKGLYVNKYSEMDAIAYFDDRVSARPPDWPPTVFMPAAGDAVFRSDWSEQATYMLMRGEHGRARARGAGHEHPDETSFILYAKGEMLALDAGYINYPNHHKVNSGRNHNLVLINGEGPPLFMVGDIALGGGNDAFLEDFYSTKFMDSGTVTARYGNTDIQRRVLFAGKQYFAVADMLSSEEENLYEWRLHGNGGGTSGGSYRRQGALARWTRDRGELLAYQAEAAERKFSERDTVHSFAYAQELTHTFFRVETSAKTADFLTILFPRGFNEPEPLLQTLVSSGGQAVEVATELWRDQVWVRERLADQISIEVESGVIVSDARMGFARFVKGRLRALALHDGSYVKLNGEVLVEADAEIELSLAIGGRAASGYVRGSDSGYLLSIKLGQTVKQLRHSGIEIKESLAAAAFELSGAGALDLSLGEDQAQDTAVAIELGRSPIFALYPTWPNPFNSSSNIRYALAQDGRVRLDIYDLIGQRIRSLVSEYQTAATYEIGWDGKMESGANAASGVYLVKLSVGPKLMTRKLLLLR